MKKTILCAFRLFSDRKSNQKVRRFCSSVLRRIGCARLNAPADWPGVHCADLNIIFLLLHFYNKILKYINKMKTQMYKKKTTESYVITTQVYIFFIKIELKCIQIGLKYIK